MTALQCLHPITLAYYTNKGLEERFLAAQVRER